MPRPVKRSYDATSRRAQADVLRRRVVETATPLFIDQGYEATSMRQLAAAAGVSTQTLYNSFESKFGVFSAVMNVIVAGDHEPVAVADRPEAHAMVGADGPSDLVAALVALGVPILERLNEIYPTLRSAASSDPQVAEAYRHFVIEARHADMRGVGEGLAAMGALPEGLDAVRATDIAWTVLSPDTYHLLVTHRGWTRAEFADWAATTLARTIVG